MINPKLALQPMCLKRRLFLSLYDTKEHDDDDDDEDAPGKEEQRER
jgi:hypothetical protein